MSDDKPLKVRVPGRAPTDDVELELVSTQALNVMLRSQDTSRRKAIEDIAATGKQGVLARDSQNGEFAIIEDDDLQFALQGVDDAPRISRPADVTLEPLSPEAAPDGELSLVSTMALRKVLGKPEPEPKEEPQFEPIGSFDPYNSS